jgi:hypothetical protein
VNSDSGGLWEESTMQQAHAEQAAIRVGELDREGELIRRDLIRFTISRTFKH